MPRTARAIEGGMIYHVLNRGNGRMRIFHKPADYEAFEQVLAEGLERYAVDLLTYCLLPNHWLCEASHNQCYVKFERLSVR